MFSVLFFRSNEMQPLKNTEVAVSISSLLQSSKVCNTLREVHPHLCLRKYLKV